MNIENFKPDETGKFSPLLYRYLKKNAKFGCNEVWQRTNIHGDGSYSDTWRVNELIIGSSLGPCVHGRTLGSIIRGERGCSGQMFEYAIKMFGLRNITKKFWKEYANSGRCAFDPQHMMVMIGDENRFSFTDKGLARTCNWCGKVHIGTKRVRVVRHPYIEWKEAA